MKIRKKKIVAVFCILVFLFDFIAYAETGSEDA
jgi:hypothetical protein